LFEVVGKVAFNPTSTGPTLKNTRLASHLLW